MLLHFSLKISLLYNQGVRLEGGWTVCRGPSQQRQLNPLAKALSRRRGRRGVLQGLRAAHRGAHSGNRGQLPGQLAGSHLLQGLLRSREAHPHHRGSGADADLLVYTHEYVVEAEKAAADIVSGIWGTLLTHWVLWLIAFRPSFYFFLYRTLFDKS